MRRIWRKWISLALGLVAAPVMASEPIGSSASRQREVIAQSAPVTAETTPSAAAIRLERPRILPVAAASDGIEQTAFSSDPGPRSVIRGQTADIPPPSLAPMPTPVVTSMPGGPVRSTVVNVTPGQTYVSGPTEVSGPAEYGMPGIMDDAYGTDPDRFASGDGVVQRFNNIVYFDSEYLYWALRGGVTPPLLTVDATTATRPGVIGNGTSSVAFGGTRDETNHSGYRFRAGAWLDRDHSIGIESVFFFLGKEEFGGTAMSGGSPILALPFTNALGVPSASVIAGPGGPGMASAMSSVRAAGAEFNFKSNVLAGPCAHLDALVGFRAMGLDDQINLTATSGAIIPGTPVTLSDRYSARNRFYGGQVGLQGEIRRGPWSLNVLAKCAIGQNNQNIQIDGTTIAGGVVNRGGIYTVRGLNIGQFSHDDFSVIPEVGITLGLQVTDRLRVHAGYTLIYWTNVARSGEQINTSLASLLQQGTSVRTSDIWAQGVTVGLEWRY